MNRTVYTPTNTDSQSHLAITAAILKSSGFNVSTFPGGILVSLKRNVHIMEVEYALWEEEVPTEGMAFSRTMKGNVVIRFS